MNRVVDSRYGRLIVNDNDVYLGQSLLEYGEFSEAEVEVFRGLITPEMTVIDVGANIGAHTLAFSRLASKVIAIEPQRPLFHALCGMCALNELHNVTCVNAAAGAFDGEIPYVEIDTGQRNNMGALSLIGAHSQDTIPQVAITKPCHFLKVDVEGMEIDVLEGAAGMIAAVQPALYVENDRRDKADALIEYVYGMDYVPYWHVAPLFNPGNAKKVDRDIFQGMSSINMLCMPRGVEVPQLEPAKVGDHHKWAEPPRWAA